MRDRSAFLKPIAHRGLHDAAKGIVENTVPAFEAAIVRGYGIECDVRPARCSTPMVFHDLSLERLIEAEGPVAAYEAAALKRLNYRTVGGSMIDDFHSGDHLRRTITAALQDVPGHKWYHFSSKKFLRPFDSSDFAKGLTSRVNDILARGQNIADLRQGQAEAFQGEDLMQAGDLVGTIDAPAGLGPQRRQQAAQLIEPERLDADPEAGGGFGWAEIHAGTHSIDLAHLRGVPRGRRKA